MNESSCDRSAGVHVEALRGPTLPPPRTVREPHGGAGLRHAKEPIVIQTFRRTIALCLAGFLAFVAMPSRAGAGERRGDEHRHRRPPPLVLTAFSSMYGVDGPFVGDAHPVDDIPGDELPWEIEGFVRGRLDSAGHLSLLVHGLVFKDDHSVPPELRGKNDEEQFRAAVSCLTESGDDVVRQNVVTRGFPANAKGDSLILATLELPNPCVAPTVFVLAGSEDKWFAVTGFESEEDE